MEEPILPDLLRENLRVVFCGTAPSRTSAGSGAYYAHKTNLFWPTLHRIGLTERQLFPSEFKSLSDLQIGLTDLCKHAFGNDSDLPKTSFDAPRLRAEVLKLSPLVLAFTSKNAGKIFLGYRAEYGRQPTLIGTTEIFVLPSTSRQARRTWDKNYHYWLELAAYLNRATPGHVTETATGSSASASPEY